VPLYEKLGDTVADRWLAKVVVSYCKGD